MYFSKIALALICCATGTICGEARAQSQQIEFNFGGDPSMILVTDPTVTSAKNALPIIVYQGDLVRLRADGCAQTGGRGRTWKRYVNPSGPNSDVLYHGQIQIPGAVEDLTDLDELVGGDGNWSRTFVVGVGDPNFQPGLISLGYTDDGYGDNGYYAHDDGTENQCRGVFDAHVQIQVCRADPAHGPTCL